ncbi:MAG: DUF308 domain-containing protein [Methanoregula sp.]|nr:DUF308 domain-containing protein [Methanoregula sp.]
MSCLIQGIIGIAFGLLALLAPDITLATFYALFWVLLAVGIAVFLLIAITARSGDSLFWFIMSAVLLVIGAFSFFAPFFVAIIFLLLIAGVAVYSGFTDITLALTHSKTKYILVPGMFIAGGVLLGVLIWFFPFVSKNLVLTVLGSFALVFGLFSILLGWYVQDEIRESYDEQTKKLVWRRPDDK